MTSITITEALKELKLLDKRILSGINSQDFVLYINPGETYQGEKPSPAVVTKKIQAGYQSVLDLIYRRSFIKGKIVESNATTKVTIGGAEMTVAAAIELKSSIQYKKSLLAKAMMQLKAANTKEAARIKEVEANVITMLANLANMGSEEKQEWSQSYKHNNLGSMSGMSIEDITKLDDDIHAFEGSVDTALSISNAVVKIEVP